MTPTNNALPELLPCPFCGLDVNDDEGCFPAGGACGGYYVRCGNPNCHADLWDYTKVGVIEKWNRRASAGREAVRWECREQHPVTGEWGDWKLIDKGRFDQLQYLAGKHSYGVHFETRELFTSQQESGAQRRAAAWEYRVRGSNEEWVRGEGEINPLWDQDYWEVRLIQPTPTAPELPKQGEGGRESAEEMARTLEELCVDPDGTPIHDDGLPWGVECGVIRKAATMLRALAKKAEGA